MLLFSTNIASITTKNGLYLWQYSTWINLLYEHSSGKLCVLSNLTQIVTSQGVYCSFDLSLSLPLSKILCQQTLIVIFCRVLIWPWHLRITVHVCLINLSIKEELISLVGEHNISKQNNLFTILTYLTLFHRSVLL